MTIRPYIRTRLVTAAVAGTLVVGSVAGATTSPTATTGEDFTSCMRSHRLPDFPTTTFGANGQVTLQAGGAGFDPFSSTYRDALRACATLLPAETSMPVEPTVPAPTPPVPPFGTR